MPLDYTIHSEKMRKLPGLHIPTASSALENPLNRFAHTEWHPVSLEKHWHVSTHVPTETISAAQLENRLSVPIQSLHQFARRCIFANNLTKRKNLNRFVTVAMITH